MAFALVVASNAHNDCLCAEKGHVHGNVCGTAGLFILAQAAHHGHRRLRRDASHFAPDILIQHHVAHNEDPLGSPFVFNGVHDAMQLTNHLRPL